MQFGRSVARILVGVLMLTAAPGSSAQPAGAKASEEGGAAKGSPAVTVTGLSGKPVLVDGKGKEQGVEAGMAVEPGRVLRTGAGGVVAMKLAGVGDDPATKPVHMTVGPDSELGRLVVEPEDGGPAVLMRLQEGLCRVIADRGGGAGRLRLLAGPLELDAAGCDVAVRFEPADDLLSVYLRNGTMTIKAGGEDVVIEKGTIRTFKGGEPGEATNLGDQQWMQILRAMSISGTVVRREPTPAEQLDAPVIHVRMKTTKGDIILALNAEQAPKTVANFLSYAVRGFYEGTIFHRVIEDFMIQAGGFAADMKRREPGPPIPNEWRNGLKNERGTIAMARMGGRPDSATSQFFINVKDNPQLDRPQRDGAAYAVFGRVVEGMDVVDAIRGVRVRQSRLNPREMSEPIEPVVILKVERVERAEVLEDEAGPQ